MKKFLSIALALALILTLAACSGSNKNSGGSERTKLVVGFDAEFPPFGYLEDGEYTGLDLDFAEELCKRKGWELVKTPINWDSKDMELNSGTIDCIWNAFTVTGREDEYTWTVPYLDSNIMVVVPENSDIRSFADLAGKIVGVQADSSGYRGITDEDADPEKKALAESFKSLEQFQDYNTAFMNMKAGALEAIVVDALAGYAQIYANPGEFRMLEEDLIIEQCAVGFKKGNTELRDEIEETFFEMLEDGAVAEIVKKYEPQGVSMDMIVLGNYKK